MLKVLNLHTWGAEKHPVSTRAAPPTRPLAGLHPFGELGSDDPQRRPRAGLGVRKAAWAGLKLGRTSLKEVESGEEAGSGEEAEPGEEALRLLRKSTR